MQKQCSQCQTEFTCSAAESTACWCMDYPNVLPVDATSDCLCPQCLTQAIQSKVKLEIDTVDIHQRSCEQATRFHNQPLIEGLDYVIENNLWVFSRWFHLKRGMCCGNRCRNCPYGYVNVMK
jgi:hypothetical protein